MKHTARILCALAIAFAAPAWAQNQDLGEPLAEGGEVEALTIEGEALEEEGPLRGTVTATSDWQDLGIAIPAFATDRDQPTPANANGTAALGREIARVITANLRNNGLFKPTGPDALPSPQFQQVT
ncbi:MAG: Tol-Pal system protein TolB, partial [Pseudomonadota bacterium]